MRGQFRRNEAGPDIHDVYAGSEPFPTTREELMRFQGVEHDKWHRVIVGAGIDPA
jgi:hypothetical protein